jgi:two-component system chemotaxis sensor kinase CheA
MSDDPYKYFRIEARELLSGLGQGVLELEKGGAEKELVNRLFRLAHTLKGAARVVRLPTIAEEAHAIEDALAPLRAGQRTVPREDIDGVLRRLDAIAAGVTALDAPSPAPAPRAPRRRWRRRSAWRSPRSSRSSTE